MDREMDRKVSEAVAGVPSNTRGGEKCIHHHRSGTREQYQKAPGTREQYRQGPRNRRPPLSRLWCRLGWGGCGARVRGGA